MIEETDPKKREENKNFLNGLKNIYAVVSAIKMTLNRDVVNEDRAE